MPESAGPAIPGRSYTIAAGVTVDSADVEGVIWAAGGVPGGHSLYVKDGVLRYTFNWVGTHLQDVVADRTARRRPARLRRPSSPPTGRAATRRCPAPPARSPSTSTTRRSGRRTIVTQPGYFCLTGDGICVGRDSASAVTPEYEAPFPFTGGTIDKVVVDVSGDPYVDHEAPGPGLVLHRLTRSRTTPPELVQYVTPQVTN